jgi:O-antigen/teichoic acid export membrane protein
MRAKNRRDVRRASQTWTQRRAMVARRRRNRKIMQVFFAVGGLLCGGLGSFTEILMLVWFGLVGPLLVRWEWL